MMKSWKNTSYFNDEIDVQEKRQYDPEKKEQTYRWQQHIMELC